MNDVNPGISGACAGCISRRAFLADSAALAALATLAAACTDATSPRRFEPLTIKVGDFPELGTLNRFAKPDDFRVVKRTGTGTFVAFDRSCTHEFTPVDPTNDGSTFICPNHGSRFDNNGAVTLGPASAPLAS